MPGKRKSIVAAEAPAFDNKRTRVDVLSMGSGDMAQLGRGSDEADREAPTPALVQVADITKLAVGALHNLVCDGETGAVVSWGCNDDGALGRTGDEWLPTPVAGWLGQAQQADAEERAHVWKLACGASHSLVLTSDEQVWACGLFRDANGPMTDAATTTQLARVTGFGKHGVVDVASGDHHAVALDHAGNVYQWGRGNTSLVARFPLSPHSCRFALEGSYDTSMMLL
jgi:regulator of chromosome condensation